jgi:hypothetical protein
MVSLQIYDPLREEWFTAIPNITEAEARAIGGALDVLITWRISRVHNGRIVNDETI